MGNFSWHNLEAGYLINQFISYFHQSKSETIFSPVLFFSILVLIIAGIIVWRLFRWFYSFKKSLTEKSVLLELTPPAFTDKSAYTTGQLFSVVHGMGRYQTIWERLLGIKPKLSFEITSSKDQGIRYLVRTTPQYVNNFKRYILSYMPQVRVKEVGDYLSQQSNLTAHNRILEFKLSRHFAYPLQRQDTLGEHDPVAYVTGMMTKLSPDESISLQIVLSPVKTNETHVIKQMVLRNENVLGYLDSIHVSPWIKPVIALIGILFKLVGKLSSELQWVLFELMHPNTQPQYANQGYNYLPF